jgi:hypothetical protein
MVEVKKRNDLSDYDLRTLNDFIEPLTNPYKNLSHNLQGGKRCRRTCRKRILNKNMKSMHRGRSGKRRSFRKY